MQTFYQLVMKYFKFNFDHSSRVSLFFLAGWLAHACTHAHARVPGELASAAKGGMKVLGGIARSILSMKLDSHLIE